MVQKILGEQPFQILATNFSISPSEQDYTLQISADGSNFSDLFTVSAGQTKMVTNVANGSYYRLKNNESAVEINWRTQCNDGQGGGGGGQGPQGPAGPQGPQGPAGGGGDSGQVQTQIDESISAFSQELQEGQPIVGMAAQLYSPDGVTSNGHFAYRTTAGDADVATGDAELRKLEGNSDYSDVQTSYDASAVLMRNGEPVEGFTYDITTGDVTTYEAYVDTAQTASVQPKMARMKMKSTNSYPYFVVNNTAFQLNWTASTQTLTPNSNVTEVIANQEWSFNKNGNSGTITWDGEWLTFVIENGSGYVERLDNGENYEIGELIDNDLFNGESTYTYGLDSWDPELPLAISNMQINGEPYGGETDDVIVINKSMSVSGSTKYPQPDSFVALGLNSFDYTCEGILTTSESDCKIYYDSTDDNGKWGGGTGETGYSTYFVKAVAGLADGYVIHSPNGYLEFGVGLADADNYDDADFNYTSMVEVEANKTYVVYPTTAMPYVVFAVADGNETDICVHPRWSGKEDNGFEEYSESVVDLSGLAEYPLYSVGDYRNVIDLKNGVFSEYVTAEPFDAGTLNDYLENGYSLGVDIAYDENYIYLASDTPNEISISADYSYKDNDFSVEYFIQDGEIMLQPVYAETFYITNLVDKLRRMQADFIHLDDPNTEGEVGKTYEYQGRLMRWVAGSGYTAEWLKRIDQTDPADSSTGLIYAIIPDGQKLFEYKYQYGGEWRNVIYSGNTLYCTSTGGTVISAVTIGQTFTFETQQYGFYNMNGIYRDGYIGFKKTGYLSFQNVWDGKINGGHYELLDHYNHPYPATTSDYGIPRWNADGQIISKGSDISTKSIHFNSNENSYTSSHRVDFFTNGTNNGPEYIFAPTTGGAQGQTLVSGGDNAAPVWETRIKVVKITSDAYEALTTKDPNTLYAIVDE